jgi:hypothetical protein
MIKRLKRWWAALNAPEPPCNKLLDGTCERYGARDCPCADIDAWSYH